MDAERKKLLIVHMSLYSGGAERSLFNFLQTLPKELYDVDLLLFRREGDYIEKLPEHIHLVEPSTALKWLFWNPGSQHRRDYSLAHHFYRVMRALATGLSRLLNRGKSNGEKQYRWKLFYRHLIPEVKKHYDVAMAYLHGEITYFTMDKVHADRKLAWVHNDYLKTDLNVDFDNAYYARYDSVATISDTCLEILNVTFPEQKEKSIVLPNLVSEREIWEQAAACMDDAFDKTRPAILSVGRLEQQKAPEWSVEAMSILKQRGCDACWYWLGSGSMAPMLKDRIRELELEDNFKLLGLRQNPYPYMRLCDVFVQNSRYEGKSIALDEAKILAKPLVITAYPTAHDQLTEDEGIITAMNPEAIADGIERVLSDEGLRRKLQDTLLSRHYGNEGEIHRYIEWIEGVEVS